MTELEILKELKLLTHFIVNMCEKYMSDDIEIKDFIISLEKEFGLIMMDSNGVNQDFVNAMIVKYCEDKDYDSYILGLMNEFGYDGHIQNFYEKRK